MALPDRSDRVRLFGSMMRRAARGVDPRAARLGEGVRITAVQRRSAPGGLPRAASRCPVRIPASTEIRSKTSRCARVRADRRHVRRKAQSVERARRWCAPLLSRAEQNPATEGFPGREVRRGQPGRTNP